MQNPSQVSTSSIKTPLLFWWLVGAGTALALIPTLWPALDLVMAGLFVGTAKQLDSVQWFWVEWINFYVPAAFRTLLVVALAGWVYLSIRRPASRWRLPLAFVVLAGALGPGLVVNLGFKDHWQRARPYQVQEYGGTQQFTRAAVMTDQCSDNCSFVSGHVACGFFFASLMLVHRRRQYLWATAGVLGGLLIGFARMSDAAHWLSDVLWAGPITLLSSWVVWRCLLRLYPEEAVPAKTTTPSPEQP